MSGNGIEFPELPMTQEWQEGGSYRAGTQRAGGGSRLVFGRDGTGV